MRQTQVMHTAISVRDEEGYRALTMCMHRDGSPQDSGRQLIITVMGCQGSVFPFPALHTDPELGGMFIFYSSTQHIKAETALAGICAK